MDAEWLCGKVINAACRPPVWNAYGFPQATIGSVRLSLTHALKVSTGKPKTLFTEGRQAARLSFVRKGKLNRMSTTTMSSNIKRITVLCAVFSLPALAFAQKTDDDFKPFWEKFKAAAIKSDKHAVAALSKFPIGMSYGIRSVRTKSELIRRYKQVFSEQSDAAKCFATKEPDKDSANPKKYSVACPDAAGNEVVIYWFERGPNGWRFVALDNINE